MDELKDMIDGSTTENIEGPTKGFRTAYKDDNSETPVYFDANVMNVGYASRLRLSKRNKKTEIVNESVTEDDNQKREIFKRTPRHILEVPSETVEILAPPQVGSKPELNLVSTFLPMLITVGISIFMATVMGSVMMLVYTLPMTLSGATVSIVNYRKQLKTFKNKEELGRNKYLEHIDNVTKQLSKLQHDHLAALTHSDPDTQICIDIVQGRKERLWERKPTDIDFASVRVGTGTIPASFEIRIPHYGIVLEENEFQKMPKQLNEKYSKTEGAPIIFDLQRKHILGVSGSSNNIFALITNILIQLTTHHTPNDLKIVCICDSVQEESIGWIKNLPHNQDDNGESVYFANSIESAEALFSNIAEILKKRDERISSTSTYGKKAIELPFLVCLILQPGYLSTKNPVGDYLFKKNQLGVGTIMAVEDKTQLPVECSEIIELSGRVGKLYNTNNIAISRSFVVDDISGRNIFEFAKSMSPLISDDVAKQFSLPSNFSVLDMLNVSSISEFDIQNAWNKTWSNYTKSNSLAAPIGIMSNEKLLSLDITDSKEVEAFGGKIEGAHGLIAGTTGCGKSELITSYILSMALYYSPAIVSFFLIEYKGNSLTRPFVNLPHVSGIITDIDGEESDIARSLLAIKGELDRRKQVFANSGAHDIHEYLAMFMNGKVSSPMPHLIVVVDEFAELKDHQPEFMKDLVSTARVGRSYGMHLILATQNPSGKIDDQTESNIRFRICLKTADEKQSREVLKRPEAASIEKIGRAYLQVGADEVFELFQSAYSGGKDSAGVKQVDRIVSYIETFCKEKKIAKAAQIALPALGNCIPFKTSLVQGRTNQNITAELGVLDAPEELYQGAYHLDISSGNTIIIGATQFGKTNALQTIIRSLAETYTPKQVNIYIMDFASMFLNNYAGLPHVGGVVCSYEEERVKNLFKYLHSEILRRKEIIKSHGVSSFSTYCEAGFTDLPQIVLIIDNFTSLKNMYLSDEDRLLPLIRDGISVGISTIMTNAETSGLSLHYLPSIPNRIALYCNDTSDIRELFGSYPIRIENTPGRCLLQKDKKIYKTQVYQAFDGKREIDRSKQVHDFVDQMQKNNLGMKAVLIPEVPENLRTQYIYDQLTDAQKNESFALGMDYSTISPVTIPFDSQFILTLLGKNSQQKKMCIETLVADVMANISIRDTKMYIVDSMKKEYSQYADYPFVEKYTAKPEAIFDILEDIEADLNRRSKIDLSNDWETAQADSPLLLTILNNKKALELLSGSKEHLKIFDEISKEYRSWKVLFIVADIDNSTVSYSSHEMLKKIRDERKALIFDSLKEVKMFDIPHVAIKNNNVTLGTSDAFYLNGDDIFRIKLAKGDSL